jgi:hypothetical protein
VKIKSALKIKSAVDRMFYQATHNKILILTQIFNIDFQCANGLD